MNARANRRLLVKLAVIATGMFGFGFALVPFYKAICEAAGLNDLMRPSEVVPANTQVDAARSVTVEFDANTHDMPWRFRPLQNALVVHPGQVVHAEYEVTNTRAVPVSGQAIPSYGPALAANHLMKMECFCFARQTLAPGEVRRMPVVFIVAPSLPAEVNTVTLSYTFFAVEGATRADAPPPGERG